MADHSPRRVALLAIHPRHAEAIFDGRKRVELRRTGLSPRTTHVIVYATAPVQAIVGWFEVAGIDYNTPDQIWETHNGSSGLSQSEFHAYFDGTDSAVAIHVGSHFRLDPPVDLGLLPSVKRPPQSFRYLSEDEANWLLGDADSRYRQGSFVNL
jgi:predicted transcriptional regulator